jgi:hypothetical protein
MLNPAPGAAAAPDQRPLGENPEDRLPIPGVLAAVESMLRQPRRVMYHLRQPGSGHLILALLMVALVCSLVYGVVIGTFSGERQLWAAPVKIAAGLIVSALICLPSLYIFSCLSGSQARIIEVVGLIAGLLALMTVLLVGFAPVAWIFSQSTNSLPAMGALHFLFWVIATWFGLRFLNAGFTHLSAKPGGTRIWAMIFLLVMLQMTTALRPLIGKSDTFWSPEKKFFLNHWTETMAK